jgi:hypothetical protein
MEVDLNTTHASSAVFRRTKNNEGLAATKEFEDDSRNLMTAKRWEKVAQKPVWNNSGSPNCSLLRRAMTTMIDRRPSTV